MSRIQTAAVAATLATLVGIHAADMVLTEYYVGNNWESETFPPMRWCIRTLGIEASLWVSRVLIYTFMAICWWKKDNRAWRCVLVWVTLVYWTAMIPWLITLGFIEMPPMVYTLAW